MTGDGGRMTGESGPATGDGGSATDPVRVLRRFTMRTAGQLLSCVILVFASVAFVTGGLAKPDTFGGIAFIVLGVVGIAAFGTGLFVVLGPVLGRRPVLILDDDGVRVPAALPLPGRDGRVLPWDQVAAVCVVDRGTGTGKGARHHVAFLPNEATAEAVRTATKAQLVALTLPDVPLMTDAVPWTFTVDRTWTASVKDLVTEARRRGVPIIDRRNK